MFNQFDEPGRYIYIRDNVSKDYWSASWQPVGKDLNEYKSECHHGTAYTKMMADYSGIHSEVRYYVPLNKTYEVWNLSVTNNSDKARSLNITGYAEFTNNSNYEQDQVNLQYSQYITKTVFVENRVRQMIHANLDRIEDGKEIDNKDVVNRFIGLAGATVDSWCGDRGEFLGEYHRYGNPVGVESGKLNNHGNYNENSCGAITTVLELAPGETKTIAFLVGMIDNETAGKIVASYTDTKAVCDKELEELIAYWHGKLSHFQINTPSDEFNTMINTWNAYNCFMTFIWSRAASLHTVDSETDTDTVIQSRIFRVLYTLHLRWLLKRSDSCSQHRLITVEDFRLSSLHTIRDMRILLTTLPMYRRQDTRLTELMMHYGFPNCI